MRETLSDIGEFGLIARLQSLLGTSGDDRTVGIGDDGAVFPLPISAAGRLVVTTDTMIEGRHFRRDFASLEEIGAKLMAVNLSDLAAMGAVPIGATVSLQLPADFFVDEIEQLYRGMQRIAAQAELQILGGDTVQSGVCAFGLTAFGHTDNPLLRSTAVVGDDIWVSGEIGGGGLGLAICRGEIDAGTLPDGGHAALQRYRTPTPRTELGKQLSLQRLATAAIDISDGLLQDLGHVARASGVDLLVSLAEIPLIPGCRGPLEAAVAGDDYELAFTASAMTRGQIEALRALAGGMKRIGTVGGRSGASGSVRLERQKGESPVEVGEALAAAGLQDCAGYQHFVGGR